MLCEKCKKRPAEVHVQQIDNGVKSEVNLCGQCAGEMQIPVSFEKLLQNLMDSFISISGSDHVNQGERQDMAERHVCPACGMSFQDIKTAGRLGCASCYESFQAEMGQVLRGMQGSSLHRGKLPRRGGAGLIQKRQAAELRRRLKNAVENEEYEEAARLRDEIRALDAAEPNKPEPNKPGIVQAEGGGGNAQVV